MKYIVAIALLLFTFFAHAQSFIQITPEEALEIGVKIWYNESAGTVSGLTSWSAGENFASMGIGHFIWYPYGVSHTYSESFPDLLRYMQEHGITIPHWLQGNWTPYCPWSSRDQFAMAQNSPQMIELREFLLHTIPVQTEFMIDRMENALPEMLSSVPPEEKPYIESQFYRIAATPLGVYALVDYVNFKGIGVTPSDTYDPTGWGLLEVFETMKYAPPDLTPLQAFVWSANEVLTRRVVMESPKSLGWVWLPGWRNRLKTYLD